MCGRSIISGLLAGLVAIAVTGCTTTPPSTDDLLKVTEAQMKMRSLQTRTFDLDDRRMAMRAVLAALQDLGFIIERANEPLGLVTAARFAEPRFFDVVGITVTVRNTDNAKVVIRINAIYNNAPVTEPKVYQNFFASLERSMFIGRN